MKKTTKRLLFAAILLLTVCAALVACNGGTADPTPTAEPTEEQKADDVLSIVGADGSCDFQVVRSDTVSASSYAVKCAAKLRTAIINKFGSGMRIVTDWAGKSGDPETEYEILVGSTNREESSEVYDTLSEFEFAVQLVDGKIVLIGYTDYGNKCACDYFTENFIDAQTGALTIPKNLNYRGTYSVYYTIDAPTSGGSDRYDTVLTMTGIQGILNRESEHKVYVQSADSPSSDWLKVMTSEGHWLADYAFDKLDGLDALMKIAVPYLKGAVIWDPDIPATVNAATTVAGVEDYCILTAKQYEKYKSLLGDKPVIDLRGKFDGSQTGSVKNDVYKWAIDNYLEKGLCSRDFICYYTDTGRSSGDTAYISQRDWATYNRAFVFDLSPWGDEAPYDELDQPVGADLATFERILTIQENLLEGKSTFEVCGFFNFEKYSRCGNNTVSKHETVPAEWETVYLISAHGGYQNTTTEWCWNQSLHSQYEYGELKNNRPTTTEELDTDKVYLCFFMADYDATYPLYNFLQKIWQDPNRGKIPLAWGINPTLLDSYPDIISYYYETATPNDYFTSDASAAGYFNPSRVPEDFWDVMVAHNKDYFKRMDLTIAPMILDWRALDETEASNMASFATDGLGTIVCDFHNEGGRQAEPYLVDDEVVLDELYNGMVTDTVESGVASIENYIHKSSGKASFGLLRCVWVTPTYICDVVDAYRAAHPELDIEVVDIYTYFDLRGQDLGKE